MEMQNQTETTSNEVRTPIIGRKPDGSTVWYTGRTGDGWLSAKPTEAFLGFSVEGARSRATQLNRMTAVHGVYFVACVGDLAQEVK